jgi:stearoyl-CoA desaturase (delta-9 desaturase)
MTLHRISPAIDAEGRITFLSKILAFLFAMLLPAAATVVAAVLAYKGLVTTLDIQIFAGMFLATGIGVTVGYHRLFTHRSFETYAPVRYFLAFLGGMAAEGAPIIWASQHRQHHQSSDEVGDPHSPHVDRKPGFFGALKALWHSHYGHVFSPVQRIDPDRFAPDLSQEWVLRIMEKAAAIPVIAGFAIPFGIGYHMTKSWEGAWTGLLWGGFVRLFVITHATGAVNSICHFFGRQPFVTGDHSRNVWWLVPFTFGESWHNGHHAFPTSARHGLRWWEIDPSWITIWLMEQLGFAWNVIRIQKDRIDNKIKPTSL